MGVVKITVNNDIYKIMAKLLSIILIVSVQMQSFLAQRFNVPRDKTTTTTEIPTPFEYEFAAGRAPVGKPDRFVNSKGDAEGTITGSYTYLDPNYQWQRVNYKASKENGFEILPGSTLLDGQAAVAPHPRDSVAVQRAKAQHEALYQQYMQVIRLALFLLQLESCNKLRLFKRKRMSLRMSTKGLQKNTPEFKRNMLLLPQRMQDLILTTSIIPRQNR